MSANPHSVFVLSVEGKPLTPTTPSKARKLLKGGVAKKVWSKFNTFGIQMLMTTREHHPISSMGVDQGTSFEGYSVIVGDENVLNIKLDIPKKKTIMKKLTDRRILRRNRRSRKCRRREARFNNRKRSPMWIAPSQKVIVDSRIKIIKEIASLYPITKAGLEDVCFNHAKHKWGANFSTIEIGKSLIRKTFSDLRITLHEYKGWETKEIRERYGYNKGSDKSRDHFESHCSDSLSLASVVHEDVRVEPGSLVIVDDTYRCVRRQIHYTQPKKGGVRDNYSRGTIGVISKGRIVGNIKKVGQLVGRTGKYLFIRCDTGSGRTTISTPTFISTHFRTR